VGAPGPVGEKALLTGEVIVVPLVVVARRVYWVPTRPTKEQFPALITPFTGGKLEQLVSTPLGATVLSGPDKYDDV
jgi:hypothetical protein